MADPSNTGGAPPSHVHIGKKKGVNWLAWVALIAGILALLLALSRCSRDEPVATTAPPSAAATEVVAATPGAGKSAALAGTSGLGRYLASTEAAPHTFTFEKLNFDTAKSAIRPADQEEITTIATTLKQYSQTKIRIAGYADARGPAAANVALGKARAESVKAALVAKGIDGGRIETVSGGESDPIDSNNTVSGQAENRRTELVVTAK